jgi:hypothetical protein
MNRTTTPRPASTPAARTAPIMLSLEAVREQRASWRWKAPVDAVCAVREGDALWLADRPRDLSVLAACCPDATAAPCRSCAVGDAPAGHPDDMADDFRREYHLAIARTMSGLGFAADDDARHVDDAATHADIRADAAALAAVCELRADWLVDKPDDGDRVTHDDPSMLRDDETPRAYPVFYPAPDDVAWDAECPTLLATLARVGDLFRASGNAHLRWLAEVVDEKYEGARRTGAMDGETLEDRLEAERASQEIAIPRASWASVASSMGW